MFKIYPIPLIMLAALSSAQAAFTPLGTSVDDPLNYGSFTSSVLDSITLNGNTYTTDQLVQIELTGFAGASGAVLLQNQGGTTNPSAQQRRDFLETDWRGDTGLINPSFVADSVTANFTVPVRNVAGADMFLYEINNTGADGFQIRINGIQLTVGSSDYGDSGANTFNETVMTLDETPTDLSGLLTLGTTVTSSDITQDIKGVAIDFSDFGLALGETVSSFSFNSVGGSSFDPVIIAAVPEPGVFAMLSGMLSLVWVAMRRRLLNS